jgi:hypothetical protein
MPKYVQALRAFDYDSKIGRVLRGQVFPLGGHVNDASLLEHRFIVPHAGKFAGLPADSSGRRFVNEAARNRAGQENEVPQADVVAARRESVARRVVRVGA